MIVLRRGNICLFVSIMEIHTRNFHNLSKIAEKFERECDDFRKAHPSTYIEPGNIQYEPDSDEYQLRIICIDDYGYAHVVYDFERRSILLDAIFISPQFRCQNRASKLLTHIAEFIIERSIEIDRVEAFTTSDGGDACYKLLKRLLGNRF